MGVLDVEPRWSEYSPAMRHARWLCECYARADRPVVFEGPVGAGKTHLAKYLHAQSGRSGDFVAVSAGELTDTLFADTLFGHVRGAFTGAHTARRGVFERAAQGSVLFDDLAFMSRAVQAAILRAVEDRHVTPLGAARDIPLTCRELYASTVPLSDLVEAERLLADLESRLGELVVPVPGLAERRAEIRGFAVRFAQEFAGELRLGTSPPLGEESLQLLMRYDWPKNVRELKAVVERAVLLAVSERADAIAPRHLPARIGALSGSPSNPPRSVLTPAVVAQVVRAVGGNRSEAARRLGVHRNTVARYLSSTVQVGHRG